MLSLWQQVFTQNCAYLGFPVVSYLLDTLGLDGPFDASVALSQFEKESQNMSDEVS